MATDPVCGMTVDEDQAAGKADYQETSYYFCAQSCKEAFEKDPAKFLPQK